MITKNPMQLKAYIKKKAAEKHISAQLVMQNYMLERLLERISLSPYKHNFIINKNRKMTSQRMPSCGFTLFTEQFSVLYTP